MLGLVDYHAAEEPPVRRLGGACFRAVYVARGSALTARLSAAAAARTLARAGTRRALFPEDYAYRAVFERAGVGEIPFAPLRRAAAAQITRCYLERLGLEARGCTVLFTADDVSGELRAAVAALACDVRGIALAARGGEKLADALRRRCGVAVRLAAPGEALPCDLNVVLAGGKTSGRTLALGDSTLRVVYDAPLPERTLAALWELGELDASALRVREVVPEDSTK